MTLLWVAQRKPDHKDSAFACTAAGVDGAAMGRQDRFGDGQAEPGSPLSDGTETGHRDRSVRRAWECPKCGMDVVKKPA